MQGKYIVALIAVSCYGLLGPLAKKVSTQLPPMAFISLSSMILFVVCGILSLAYEKMDLGASMRSCDWRWLLAFSMINIIGYIGYLWSISRMPVTQYQMFIIFSPVAGAVLARVLLNEPLSPRYLLAGAVMALGLYIAMHKPATIG